ncbi:MAG: hypothetical protein AB7N76_33535 [Planctomycetota bacterium]
MTSLVVLVLALLAGKLAPHDSHSPSDHASSAFPVLAQRSAAASEPPARDPAPPAPPVEAGRATTWVVLRVGRGAPEIVTVVHKDGLPYAPRDEGGAARFRLVDPDGGEHTGPCAWPRLCGCERAESHTEGCIRRHHEASVRLRLPRLRGPSQVVIERRAADETWAEVARVKVKA